MIFVQSDTSPLRSLTDLSVGSCRIFTGGRRYPLVTIRDLTKGLLGSSDLV